MLLSTSILSGNTNPKRFDMLGRGYDVFDKVADSGSLKDRLIVCDHNEIEIDSNSSSKIYVTHGKSMREYSENISTKLNLKGRYGFFKSEIDAEFGTDIKKNSEKSFFKFEFVAIKETGSLPGKEILEDGVKENLDTLDPIKLFEKYGTHYLKKASIGGSLSQLSSISKSTYKNIKNFKAVAEASYDGVIGGGSVKVEEGLKDSVKKFNEEVSWCLTSKGGKPEETLNIYTHNDYTGWLKSIDTESSFCFMYNDSLVPIWELLEEGERKTKVRDAYNTYAEGQGLYYSKYYSTDEDIVPVYGYTSNDGGCWYFTTDDYLKGLSTKIWTLRGRQFYVFNKKVDKSIPVYRYHAYANYTKPENRPYRYVFSTKNKEKLDSMFIKDQKDPVFWIFATKQDDTIPVYKYTYDNSKALRGGYYSTDNKDNTWRNQGIEFYIPMVSE